MYNHLRNDSDGLVSVFRTFSNLDQKEVPNAIELERGLTRYIRFITKLMGAHEAENPYKLAIIAGMMCVSASKVAQALERDGACGAELAGNVACLHVLRELAIAAPDISVKHLNEAAMRFHDALLDKATISPNAANLLENIVGLSMASLMCDKTDEAQCVACAASWQEMIGQLFFSTLN